MRRLGRDNAQVRVTSPLPTTAHRGAANVGVSQASTHYSEMKTAISGPTVAPLALQFDPISSAAMFPRVARLARDAGARAEGPFGTLLRRVELPASALTSTAYPPRVRLTPHAHTAAFLLFVRDGGFLERHGQGSERCDRFTCIASFIRVEVLHSFSVNHFEQIGLVRNHAAGAAAVITSSWSFGSILR